MKKLLLALFLLVPLPAMLALPASAQTAITLPIAANAAADSDQFENRQTLGSLVWYCQPRGRAFVDAGETDGKGVAATLFEILVPWFA